MKTLIKNIKALMTLYYFKSYRLIVTENIIEIKLTPKSNKETEVVYSMQNTKHNICFLSRSLEADFEKYKKMQN